MSFDEAADRADLARRLFLGMHEMRWRSEAACLDEDHRLFFEQRPEAKDVCNVCPVTEQCLAHALEVGERGAIWGALTDTERAKVKRGERMLRVCAWCHDEFYWQPKAGRPPACCSDACRDASRYIQQLESKDRNGSAVGTFLNKGHGQISRYQSGCRCSACRRASRVARAAARARRAS